MIKFSGIKFSGVFNGSDGRSEVTFTIDGELTEDKIIAALKEAGFELNTSFYTNGDLTISNSRIDIDWENGDTLSVFGSPIPAEELVL